MPYQVLVIAPIVNDTLYMLPSSWLHSQDHLLRRGEVDPHKFVGRDDRPANGRWSLAGQHYFDEPEVCSLVLDQGERTYANALIQVN